MANIEKLDSNLFVHWHPQHRGQIIVFQSHFRSVRIVAKNLWIDAVNVIVRQIQYRHVFTITEGIIRHFFNEIMAACMQLVKYLDIKGCDLNHLFMRMFERELELQKCVKSQNVCQIDSYHHFTQMFGKVHSDAVLILNRADNEIKMF